ncbi:MAG: AMP-binding protein, partial [Oscillospiraceae bacterium]|nr:AMP-binding protein [Oscillospiraceae bacterium]
MEQSIALMIQKFATATPDKTALIVEGERCSYQQLAAYNRKAAAYLQAQGIASGDRIVVEADHTLPYAYLWYGIQLYGATFVPV